MREHLRHRGGNRRHRYREQRRERHLRGRDRQCARAVHRGDEWVREHEAARHAAEHHELAADSIRHPGRDRQHDEEREDRGRRDIERGRASDRCLLADPGRRVDEQRVVGRRGAHVQREHAQHLEAMVAEREYERRYRRRTRGAVAHAAHEHDADDRH